MEVILLVQDWLRNVKKNRNFAKIECFDVCSRKKSKIKTRKKITVLSESHFLIVSFHASKNIDPAFKKKYHAGLDYFLISQTTGESGKMVQKRAKKTRPWRFLRAPLPDVNLRLELNWRQACFTAVPSRRRKTVQSEGLLCDVGRHIAGTVQLRTWTRKRYGPLQA